MRYIELADEDAALLEQKAAAQGLTLREWLKRMAEGEQAEPNSGKNGDQTLPVRRLGAIGPLHRRDIYGNER